MRTLSAADVAGALPYPKLIDAIEAMFRSGCETPLRHHHTVKTDGPDATLLLMPAWRQGRRMGVKIVSVYPENPARGLPAVIGVYMLFDAATGEPLAALDAPELTVRRTACASALAARFLAREDASTLLMIGAGAMAPHLVRAHAAVRPIARVRLWNRNGDKSERLADALRREGLDAAAAADLEAAAREADIVSCATLSAEPLVRGEWLKPGAHLDLVGAFRPHMRESDDEAVRRARLVCDTRAGALAEAGDLADPIRRGVIKPDDVVADLFELCRGEKRGRETAAEITLFKSVGTALEDLAAAELALEEAA
jgi:ornithine cyclodeaminase